MRATVFDGWSQVTIHDGYPKATVHLLVLPRRERIGAMGELTKEHLGLLKRLSAYVASWNEILVIFLVIPLVLYGLKASFYPSVALLR